MDVGPDGSLCRLTSSYNSGACNVKIVKVSEEELKSTGVDYKLVLIGEKKSDCESASEKSDEDLSFTLESLDIELGISKPEKIFDKTEEVKAEKPISKNTGNRPFNRRFRPNNTNRHRNNYVSPGQRSFKPYNNGNKSYNRQTMKIDSNHISPWLAPPEIMTAVDPFGNINSFAVVIDPSLNTSVSSNMDPQPLKSRGLLGNSPYDRIPSNFQTGNANHFSHNPNNWSGEYYNDYQHPGQNVQMSHKPPYKKHHNRKFWKNGHRYQNKSQKNQRRGGNGRFYGQQQ